jgi:hypothetical protein
VGLVVDKVALVQVFSKNFGFPCQSSFHQLLHKRPKVAADKGLSPTPLAIKKMEVGGRTCKIDFLDIHWLLFVFKELFLQTGFSLHPQVRAYSVGSNQ